MKKITTSFILFLSLVCSAQKKFRELSIGDRCPDLTFNNVLNYPGGKLKLSAFKDRLIILDLIRTNCPSCIEAFPRFEQLQKQFGNKIQFIIVVKQNKQEWLKLTQKNKLARDLKLPVIIADSVLSSIFPYFYSPHEVWLDGSREVKAITAAEYIKPSNIQQLLTGEDINWAVKKDVGNYTFETSLLQLEEQEYYQAPLYYSAIAGHRQGTLSALRTVTDSINNSKRFTLINLPLSVLFRLTMPDSLVNNFAANRFIPEMKDPARFIFDSSVMSKYEWNIANTWCYEAVMPLNTSKQQFTQKLKQDLENFFGLVGHAENRKIQCYVLQERESSVSTGNLQNTGKIGYKTTASLVEALNRIFPIPFVDETGIAGTINLPDIGKDIYDLSKVRNLLSGHGMKLTLTEREILVYVIKEK